MKILIASVGGGRGRAKNEATERLVEEYVRRSGRYAPTGTVEFDSEESLLVASERARGRAAAHLVLLDMRGKTVTSPEIAAHLATQQEAGSQRLILGIGPADGWTDEARRRAHLLLSLGRITLPHELARVVLAEQVYRALTILAGHPYHLGH